MVMVLVAQTMRQQQTLHMALATLHHSDHLLLILSGGENHMVMVLVAQTMRQRQTLHMGLSIFQ